MLLCCIRLLCDWSFRLSPHNPHLQFCCVFSILVLIWLVLMVFFCAAVKRDSVSLLKFPFLSHVQVFSSDMFYYYYYYYYFTPLKVFHASLSWCFSSGVWVTEGLPKSPGLFSVFWPILTMWSLDGVHSSSYFHVPILRWLSQEHQL